MSLPLQNLLRSDLERFNFQLIVVWFLFCFFAGNKSSSATGRRGKAFRTNNSRNRIFPPPPNVQETNFDCANYEFPGLYADTEANCEVSDIIFSDDGFRGNFPKKRVLGVLMGQLG